MTSEPQHQPKEHPYYRVCIGAGRCSLNKNPVCEDTNCQYYDSIKSYYPIYRPSPALSTDFDLESFNAGQISIVEKIPEIQADAARQAREESQQRIDAAIEFLKAAKETTGMIHSMATDICIDKAIALLQAGDHHE